MQKAKLKQVENMVQKILNDWDKVERPKKREVTYQDIIKKYTLEKVDDYSDSLRQSVVKNKYEPKGPFMN